MMEIPCVAFDPVAIAGPRHIAAAETGLYPPRLMPCGTAPTPPAGSSAA
ncbi:MAG: hypothetical protein V9G14_11225 [Cypionkella sp.]